MRKLIIGFGLLCSAATTFAQTEKKVVAVMPFLSTVTANRNYAAQLQSIAVQAFAGNQNIVFVDRSADPLVIKELDNQIREQSISSKTLVQQGKLSGSQEIIVGNLSSVNIETKRSEGILGNSDVKYIANISYSLQVIDAATGQMISVKDFNGNTKSQDAGNKIFGGSGGILGKASGLVMADTKDEAVRKAIGTTKTQITEWINDVYPPNIRLLSVESRDKKGYPQSVLIAGLANMSAGKVITIKEITLIDDGAGGKLKREKKIGSLKVSEIQGEITVCKVKDGEEVLEEKMKTPASLKFVID